MVSRTISGGFYRPVQSHRYPLSYRQLEEIMLERGLSVDHTTIYRWVQAYAPELEKRCRLYLKFQLTGRARMLVSTGVLDLLHVARLTSTD